MPGPQLLFANANNSILSPASPQGSTLSDLFWLTLIIMSVIMAIVFVWIGYILLNFRGKPGDPDPKPYYGNTKLELTWTIIPFLIVTFLTIITIRDINVSRPTVSKQQLANADDFFALVIGHQWWWEIRYPKNKLVTANELHVPVGEKVLIKLQSADVVHDFWVWQLGPKEDMIPTQDNYIWLQPNAPGMYDGACAEFCGNSHAWMRIRVIAQTPDDFNKWIDQQTHPLAAPDSAAAQAGQKAFDQNTCRNCHALAGQDAVTVQVAPDLTNLGDRTTLGAGVLPNSQENLIRWLHDPQLYKPGCNMPNFHLSTTDVQQLTAFLWRQQGMGLPLESAKPRPAASGAPSPAPSGAASPAASGTPATPGSPAATGSAQPAVAPTSSGQDRPGASPAPPLGQPAGGPQSPAASPAGQPPVGPPAMQAPPAGQPPSPPAGQPAAQAPTGGPGGPQPPMTPVPKGAHP